MNRIKIMFLFGASAASAWGQTGFGASYTADGQPNIRLESKLEPENPALAHPFEEGTASRNKTFQRYLYDKATHEYFGYRVALDRVTSSEYRITLGPISLNPAEHPISDPLAQLMPSPAFPPPQIIRIGDRIAIDFFENQKTGQKIVDYLSLEQPNCDGESQKTDCLMALIADMNGELDRKLQALIARHDVATQQTLRQSQQSWATYRDDACRSLPDRTKQLDCQLKLTRSRIHDLGAIY
jgi:uncharacterized protein YecT (DUF1311 family)